jgi:hypothetical protein
MAEIPSIHDIFGADSFPQTESSPGSSSDSPSNRRSESGGSTPFTPTLGPTKVCPRCKERKPTDLEHWYFERVWRNVPHGDGTDTWTTREKIPLPTTYCRVCTNRMKAAQARTRRFLATLPPDEAARIRAETMQGPCGVCGRTVNHRVILDPVRSGGNLVPGCEACHRFLNQCDYDLDVARGFWKALMGHLADEKRIEAEVLARTDRLSVRPHRFNPDAQDIYFSHAICIDSERRWRQVVGWLGSLRVVGPTEVET